MKRPQPYRLAFAPNAALPSDVNTVLARQFQNADQMFDILFRDFGNAGSGPFATIPFVTAAIAAALAGVGSSSPFVAMVPAADVTVPAHYAMVGSGTYELLAGITLEIEADATVEIG
jgi:hypothetical protein